MKTLKTLLIVFLPVLGFSQTILSDQDVPRKDIIHNDDVIIDGSLNVGIDAIPNRSFGFDTQILSENNLRILFEDTSNSASFPSNDWRITINGSNNGDPNFFSIDDATGNKVPFRIDAGAPTHSLRIDAQGDVGVGTEFPVLELHITDGDSPAVRLEQNGSQGFTPQTWDVAGNETNFFIRDVTHASEIPFKIKPGAPTGSIFVAANGHVGIGTEAPSDSTRLHVNGNAVIVGDLGKTGQIIGASDERIKDQIESIDQALNIIKKLDGKQYRYNQNEYPELNLPGGVQYGLVAQEVESVASDLVKSEFLKTTDAHGQEVTLKGVKYEQLIPFLINAIKEQDKVISSQQALISQLMSQSTSTEERLAKLESLISGASKSADSTKASADKMED